MDNIRKKNLWPYLLAMAVCEILFVCGLHISGYYFHAEALAWLFTLLQPVAIAAVAVVSVLKAKRFLWELILELVVLSPVINYLANNLLINKPAIWNFDISLLVKALAAAAICAIAEAAAHCVVVDRRNLKQ